MLSAAGFLAPYALACAAFPLLRRRTRFPWIAPAGICLLIMACPWFIAADLQLARYMAACSAALLSMKLIDVSVDLQRGLTLEWKAYAAFLSNPFSLVRRQLVLEPCPAHRKNVLSLLAGSAGCATGVLLQVALFRVDWVAIPFLFEHVSKVLALMLAITSGLTAGAALWRLSGGMARDTMDRPYLAHTPAQFWRRYNRLVQQFFWHDVFSGRGARHAPVRTMLLVFALSALLHEFLFYAAIGQVQGYQTAFFAVQGLAAAVTARVKVRGWATVPWVVGTLMFNLLSSVLFFASMHGVLPFYSRGLPQWLQGW
jgi:hypothetical protein